ncbi:prephenate dehydrogenase [Candidatus Omnitrophota bacterium]
MRLKKVVIIGTGLIGGSVGKTLIEKGLADEVIGICRRQSTLDRAIKEKAFTHGFVNNYEEAIPGADIVIIATPVHTIKEILDRLAECAGSPDMLVTDVGSTKKEVVAYAAKYKDKFSFLGAHPLAGSERTGVEYSSVNLFEDSVCLLTPGEDTREEDKNILKKFWETMGAKVMELTPEKHDEYLAFSSHLPHIVAYALAGTLDENVPLDMVATGFKDTTRIASSDEGLWSDIFLSNRENVLKTIERYKEILSGIEDDIRKNDQEGLKEKLRVCKKRRDEIV